MKKLLLVTASLFLLVSCGWPKTVDIINPDADFLYFYGATCPHCQELNRQVHEMDLFSQISVEKREVYFNNDNREKFLETTKSLWLDESKVGVPFVLHKESWIHVVGTDQAIELFKTGLRMQENEDKVIEESQENTIQNVTSTGSQEK